MEIITVNGIEYKKIEKPSNMVLIRTYSAGVHFGELKSREGREVVLVNARRLWSWSGACSLSQVAIDGVDTENSKISIAVPEITLTEAIEIIPLSEKAAKNLTGAAPWKK